MTGARRLPGREPLPERRTRPLPEPGTTVELVGRLVGVEGSNILEILHLEVEPDQYEAQRRLASLADCRVRITVQVPEECMDSMADPNFGASHVGGQYDPCSGTMLMEGEAYI